MQHSSGSGRPTGGENKCKLCSTKFNAVNRKRHCKVCRDAFCASCSNYRVAVPRFGYSKPVRVCANCHMRFLLIRNEIDFTFLFEEKGRRGSESLDSAMSPRGSLSGSSSPFITPRRSADGNDADDDDSHEESQQAGKRGSDEGSGLFKRGGSKRLLRVVTKKGSHRESSESGSSLSSSGSGMVVTASSSLQSSSSSSSSPSSPSSAAQTVGSSMEFDLKERDVREAVVKLQLPIFFIDRRTIEVVQRKTVVFNAGAPILLSGRPSSGDGLHLKLAEVNIAFWVLGGEAQATNHKRASMRKQRTGKGSMKYAVILDGHPIADDRGPDRTELSVVFKNLQLFDWLSFSRAMRELTTLTTIHRAENPSGSPRMPSNEMAPYFVQLLGVCVTDGSNGLQMGFVFEPMTKGSLRNCLIQCQEELNEPELTFEIARHIAVAMTLLHDKFGYIHANLSPENILVADDWTVKVGGFGNAVRPEGIPYAARSSPSPRFHLAPEVLKRGEYSFASDVYSYGMILVELTTLQPPYKQEQFKQLRKITVHTELGEAIESYGLLPAFDQTIEIGALICQCLSVDPKARPTFVEIVKRLDEMKEQCIAEMRYNMNKRVSRMPKKKPKLTGQDQQQPTLHVRINEADNTVQEKKIDDVAVQEKKMIDDGADQRQQQQTSEQGEGDEQEEREKEGEVKKNEGAPGDDDNKAKAKKEMEEEAVAAAKRRAEEEAEEIERAKAKKEEAIAKAKAAGEERERLKREEREESERHWKRQQELEEEAEREKVRERIRQMIPTRDEGKLATMAKVEQLKGRVTSSSSPSSSSSSLSTETPEERQQREKEERARRVRELTEKRRVGRPQPQPTAAPAAAPAVDNTEKEEAEAAAAVEERKREEREEIEAEERKREKDENEEKEEAEVVAVVEESEEDRKRRERDERMLKVKQIEERMKKRSSAYASPASSSPASRSPPTSNPASCRSSVRTTPVAVAATSSSPTATPGQSVDGGEADADDEQLLLERKRGLSITEAERQARKNMVRAGRERQDSLECTAAQLAAGGGGADDGMGLGIVDEVARMIGELAEHDEDIRRLKLV